MTVDDLYPFLAVRDVDAAVAFYAAAFGAEVEGAILRAPDGVSVAVLVLDGRRFGVATENPGLDTPSPETAGATTVRISLHVDDPDAAATQAVAAGARLMFPVEDQPYGMRQGRVVDPFGHHWLLGRKL
ncbi:MAG: VOC family protein [Gaiellaceae bacterium]